MLNARRLLMIAGSLSLAVAVFQAVIVFSVPASRYFGAPEELLANPLLLIVAGFVMAAVFGLCGLYAFSGAGSFRRLPLLRLGLIVISLVYIWRGIVVFPLLLVLLGYIHTPVPLLPQALASSAVSLLIGVLYLAGTIGNWRNLRKVPEQASLSSQT
jgi:hypothetical protein